MPHPSADPTLRLEIALSTAASALADLSPDGTTWHAWAGYFLYCLEEEARHRPYPAAFEIELDLLICAIHRRLEQGSWNNPPDPLPPLP